MIVLTGANGFIGSVVLGYLNKQGIDDIALVEIEPIPSRYLEGKKYRSFNGNITDPTCVIHIGANSSTLETNQESINLTNISPTHHWNTICKENNIPFIFTSTAAVYGNGTGPLNLYANSKQTSEQDMDGVILRLFNVYGPNESHKGRMASTIYHWYNQLVDTNTIKIFENSNNYCRDFIWVEDVAKTIYHFVNNYKPGTYDVGTGSSYSFESIADLIISNHKNGHKEYIPMPKDLKAQYQLNTRADVTNLYSAGVDVDSFLTPADGIAEYVKYLSSQRLF
jgi:ADP-L-glycero-D-manno-heptose 6-epimerase